MLKLVKVFLCLRLVAVCELVFFDVEILINDIERIFVQHLRSKVLIFFFNGCGVVHVRSNIGYCKCCTHYLLHFRSKLITGDIAIMNQDKLGLKLAIGDIVLKVQDILNLKFVTGDVLSWFRTQCYLPRKFQL